MNNHDNRFIVPIYKLINNNYEFWGSGFIVDRYLISAAHVFEDHTSYQIYFEDRTIELENPIYSKFIKGDNIRKDLQIYQIEILHSPFSLFIGEYQWKKDLMIDGFFQNEIENRTERYTSQVRTSEYAYEYNYREKPIRLYNCFHIFPKSKPGNSGCPILKNNVVYGMNISQEGEGAEMGSNAIRSDYIYNILDTLQ